MVVVGRGGGQLWWVVVVVVVWWWWRVEVMGSSQLLLNKFTDPRTPSMRKGPDREQMEEK